MNMLNAVRRRGLKPNVSIHFVALDRDQSAARIWRGDADGNIVTTLVVRAIEFDIELGVFLQRLRERAAPDDAVTQLTEPAILIIAKLQYVVARLGSGQHVMQPACGDAELLGVRQPFFQDGTIGEVSIFLARQH